MYFKVVSNLNIYAHPPIILLDSPDCPTSLSLPINPSWFSPKKISLSSISNTTLRLTAALGKHIGILTFSGTKYLALIA